MECRSEEYKAHGQYQQQAGDLEAVQSVVMFPVATIFQMIAMKVDGSFKNAPYVLSGKNECSRIS